MSFTPHHAVVWAEIPVTDLPAARRFYEAVFQWETVLHEDGPNPMAMFPTPDEMHSIAGHLYPGEPGTGGPTVHLEVPDTLEATADRVRDAGGTVLPMPPVKIPAGRFMYATDPDGNSLGLFESDKAA
ncbi:MAG: VOC family protein [Pseudomonadota bacterium]